MKIRREGNVIVAEDEYEIKNEIADYFIFYNNVILHNNEHVFYGNILSCVSWLYRNIGTGKFRSFGLNIEPDNDLWKIDSRYCIIHCPDSFLVWDNEKKESPKYVYTCDTFEEAIDWIQGIYVSQMIQDYLDASSENSIIVRYDGLDYTMRDIITGDEFVLSVVNGRIVNHDGRDCVEAVLDACSDDDDVCKEMKNFCDKWYI